MPVKLEFKKSSNNLKILKKNNNKQIIIKPIL